MFCNFQASFVKFIIEYSPLRKLVTVDYVGVAHHPITDEALVQIVTAEMPKWLFIFICRIEDLLLNEAGRINRDKALACKIVGVR